MKSLAETVPHRRLVLRIMAVLALVVAFVAPMTARALDTGNATGTTGSIVVHKYKTTSTSSVPGTGTSTQTPSGTPIRGVEFTLYALDTTKVETGDGVTGDAYAGKPLAKAPSSAEVSAIVAAYSDAKGLGGVGKAVGTTDSNGTYTFANLSFGYYLLVETGPVDDMTAAVPSIITLPYPSEAQDGAVTYLTDVHVYPKNVTTDLVSKKEVSGKNYVEVGDSLDFEITFNVPAQDKVYQSETSYLKATVTDILPTDAAGEPVIDYTKSSAEIWAVLTNGRAVKLTDVTDTEPNTDTSGKLVWDFSSNSSLAQAIKATNDKNSSNPVANIRIKIHTTANARAISPGESSGTQSPSVNNKVEVTLSDTSGTELISGDKGKAESGNLYSAGFGFYKVSAEDENTQSEYLAGAEFVITALNPGAAYSTEDDNLLGVIVNPGATDASKANWLTVTSAGEKGYVSFGSLTGYKESKSQGQAQMRLKYWDGSNLVDYTRFSDAVTSVVRPGSTPQDVDLWLIETKAPDGYQKLNKAVKVTITVSKASETDDLTFKVSKVDGQAVGADGFVVENTKYGQGGFALPNTGGTGALLIVLAGVASIIVAFVVRRHKNEEEQAGSTV